jgi:two-component system LytT family response regulator
MNIFIIDDEKPNRIGLSLLIEQYCPGYKVVGDADSAENARILLEDVEADILLLDIHMPKENGFDFLTSLKDHKYQVIFITAFAEYAIRAFRANAVDYLLKPIDPQDLKEALEKCNKRFKQFNNSDAEAEEVYKHSLLNTAGDLAKDGYSLRLTLPHRQGFKIVSTENILYLEASGNYTILYLDNKEELVVTRNLREFESMLDPEVFFRVHKSSVINLNSVSEYSSADGHFAILKNGEKVMISRRRLDDFMSAIDQLSKRV